MNITKCSKVWWTKECRFYLNTYCSSKLLEDWKKFKGIIRKTKYTFFDKKIQEITLKNKRPWDLINWVKKCKISVTDVL